MTTETHTQSESRPVSPSVGRDLRLARFDRDLSEIGYRLKENAWDTECRRTYLHGDDATRNYLSALRSWLAGPGWRRDAQALRTFRHEAAGEVIEIEPAGSDCSGHYLHHMKAAVTA